MKSLDKLFDTGVAVRPPLDAEALRAIPAKRGVFALVADDGVVVLLTTAADIRDRLRHRLTADDGDERRRTADLREITAAVYWRLTYSRFETDWQYAELARALWTETYGRLLKRRSAWFVAADTEGKCPCFQTVRSPGGPCEHFGPFATRRAAEDYIAALTDVFDLCRCVHILRRAPHGSPCAYKQMGRCAAPCDGTSSMESYRRQIRRAVRFAAGCRRPQRDRLTAEMNAAAAAQQYERAGTLKSRLRRLDSFDDPRLAEVRPLSDFRFVLVQRGPSRHQACAFVCDRGALAAAGTVDYPPDQRQLTEVLTRCDALAPQAESVTTLAGERMALVAAYLLTRAPWRGLILRRTGLTPGALAEAIRGAAEMLKLREPQRPAKTPTRTSDDDGAKGE